VYGGAGGQRASGGMVVAFATTRTPGPSRMIGHANE